jgi:hypothetical protein
VHRLLLGQPRRPPGRPRHEDAPRQLRRCREQLAAARAQVEALRTAFVARSARDETRCLRLLLALLFYGASLRSASACLEAAFEELAPGKSAVALRLEELCAAAEELFDEHFAGKGTCAACDEIYLSGHPVLEVVDPFSLAITAIRADAAPTQGNWETLLAAFDDLEAAVSDQGLGVSKAIAAQVERHGLDQWHLLREFACAVGRLETQAYERIADADEKFNAFVAALPFPAGTKVPAALERLEQAQAACARDVRRYDDANTLAGWLYEAARFVDAHGRVRTAQEIRGDWEAALDLVDCLDAASLYPLEKKLRGKVTGGYAAGLEERLQRVFMPPGWDELEREELQRQVCKAWTYHHRRQTHVLQAPTAAADSVAAHVGLPFAAPHLLDYCRAVFEALDRTLLASSAVECVNSLTRLREGAKRHPHPKFVYFLAWLHNTRAFTEGKRKGLTPAELLGVALPDDGCAMLLERALQRRQCRSRASAASQN